MSNDQRLRLEAIITSAESDEKTAVELLRHLHEQGDALMLVIERQQDLVTKLQDAVTAGREVSAGDAARPARARRRAALHPDQLAAIEQISDDLGAALGHEVEVHAVAGRAYRAALTFESVEDALELARRLRIRAVR